MMCACTGLTAYVGLQNSAVASGVTKNVLILNAINDFDAKPSTANPRWYVDKERGSLAIDAGKYKDQFATVATTFTGVTGRYQFGIKTLGEIDGESEYQVLINGQTLSSVTNPETDTDFIAFDHDLGAAVLTTGDVIEVSFNATSNGKIPEGETTAYARGRWTQLRLLCLSCVANKE